MPATRSALRRQARRCRRGRRARSRRARSGARRRRRSAARPRRGSGASVVRSAVSSTEIGSGSFHGVSVVGDEARRVGLGEAEADERVLDAAPELLLARERAEHLAARGQRERHVLEPEARDLLDDVDLARRRRGRARSGRRRRRRGARSRAGRAARPARPAASRSPITSSARSGRKRTTGRSGRPAWTSASPTHVAPVSSRRSSRREVGRRPGEVRVDALLPAVRALGAQALALGGEVDPVRLEVRGLEQDGGRAVADLRLLAAHDPGERDRRARRRRSSGRPVVSSRSTPSSVRIRSPGRGAADDDPAAARACRSRTRAAGCRARA